MQHMMDSLFITMSNFILMRRDAYLNHLRSGVKQDNWCALRNAPLHSYALFPDDALCKAEEDITKFESSRRTSQPGSGGFLQKKANRFHPYPSVVSGAWKQEGTKSRAPSGDQPAWRSFGCSTEPTRPSRSRGRGGFRGSKPSHGVDDNYCLNVHTAPNSVKEPNVGVVPSQDFVLSVQNVNFFSVNTRPPQKERSKSSCKPEKCFSKRCKLCSQSHLLSVCSSCSCKDGCCRNSNSSNNVVSKLSQTRFKSIKRSFSALGSPEAKIQTGTQSQSYTEACILKSCDSCTFCSYRRHVFQGSIASRKRLFPAKACRRCFFCKTVRFCDQCKRCSNCCNLSSCRGQAAGVLADLGLYGSQSMGGVHLKERLHPPLSDKASSHSGTFDSEPLCDFCQAEPFTGVGSVALSQTSHRTGTQPVLPRVLQPPLFGSKTKQQMAARFGSQCSKPVSACKNLQDGIPRVHKVVSLARGMGHIARLQRCILPHSHKPGFPKISTVPPGRSNSAISSLAIRPLHRSYGVHHCGQGGKAHGSGKWNPVTPVPRRLANPESDQRVLLLPDIGPSDPLSGTRLGRESAQVRIGPKTDLRLCGLPVRPEPRSSPSHSSEMADFDPFSPRKTILLSETVHVPHRSPNSNRKTGAVRKITHETHSVAPQTELAHSRISREKHFDSRLPSPSLEVVATEGQCPPRAAPTPLQHALQLFTDASREGWGTHLGDHTARGFWSLPESKLHINMLELKAVLLALKEFQDHCLGQVVLIATDNTTAVSYINKEGGMRSGSLCVLLWRLLSWCNHRNITLQVRHILGRLNVIADKLSHHNQVIQTEWSLHQEGPRWQSGNTLASHLCSRGSIPIMAVSGKAGSCLPLVGSLQYRTLANYMYWFPLPFQLPVVI